MKRELEPYQMIERSIIKKYRKELWTPFIVAVKRYELVQEGDKIAVCISGGKDSMLMAKLMQELQKHSDVPFELVFLVMDPGYNEINRQKIESNAELLHIRVAVIRPSQDIVFAVGVDAYKTPAVRTVIVAGESVHAVYAELLFLKPRAAYAEAACVQRKLVFKLRPPHPMSTVRILCRVTVPNRTPVGASIARPYSRKLKSNVSVKKRVQT